MLIAICTDFGLEGPYVGELQLVLAREAPGVSVVNLISDLPRFDARASAYLLAALVEELPIACVCLGIVDPGVGTERPPVVLEADGRFFVGPGNGLFALIARRAQRARWWEITWRPQRFSSTFHGRDVFAPVAARIARGMTVPGEHRDSLGEIGSDWPDELEQVVYLDAYGNAMVGTRATSIAGAVRLRVAGRELERRSTFGEAAPGEAFWYENSSGLVEIAVNRGAAAGSLGLKVGDRVEWVEAEA
jgi:S-adenosylmethionine hydrolase